MLKKVKPDVIVNWYDFDLSAYWAAALLEIPTIIQVQIFWPICPKLDMYNEITDGPCDKPECAPCILKGHLTVGSIYSALMGKRTIKKFQAMLRNAPAIVCDCNYLRERMIDSGYPSELIRVIYNGVDTERIQASYPSDEEKVVLFLAAANKKKGIEHFIRLSKHLKPIFPDVDFVWVGQTANHNDAFSVRNWVENESELNEIYKRAYLVLFPSLWPEPMALTLLEAMAHGKSIVAYDTGGTPEAIAHGENGLLVRRGKLEELIAQVQTLLLNENLARRLGRNARKTVENNFTLERMTREYLELFYEVVSEKLNQYGMLT